MKKGTYISLLAGYAVTVAVYGMWQHFGLPLLPLVSWSPSAWFWHRQRRLNRY